MKQRLIAKADDSRFSEIFPYSSDIRQNIIYRIAKEFHGYSKGNDL
jgi:hypothetical protein